MPPVECGAADLVSYPQGAPRGLMVGDEEHNHRLRVLVFVDAAPAGDLHVGL